jgi:P22 coat protein - gene protein 5
MATFITPSVIAKSALATLYNTTVLLPLVNRDYQPDFEGKQGETITVKTPATFVVKEFDQETGIELQDPTEGSFPVTLSDLPDVSFPITAKELTLELENFEEQLLNPAMEAHSQWVDEQLAEQLVIAAEANTDGMGVVHAKGTSAGERLKAFSAARRILTRRKLPFMERVYAVSPEAAEVVTEDPTLLQANTSGDTEALREGKTGRLSGFNGYESQAFGFGAGKRGQADGVAFHRSAVAAITRTLVKPLGVADSQVSTASYKGLGLRVVRDYDIKFKQDVISIDALFGTQTIRKEAAVELDFGQGS